MAVWCYRYGGILRIERMKKEENNKIQTRRGRRDQTSQGPG